MLPTVGRSSHLNTTKAVSPQESSQVNMSRQFLTESDFPGDSRLCHVDKTISVVLVSVLLL